VYISTIVLLIGVAYIIKGCVDQHLLRLIENSYQVASLDEYAEVLSLSRNKATLEKQLRHRERALKVFKDDSETAGGDEVPEASPSP
jgi:hypothetical protein